MNSDTNYVVLATPGTDAYFAGWLPTVQIVDAGQFKIHWHSSYSDNDIHFVVFGTLA